MVSTLHNLLGIIITFRLVLSLLNKNKEKKKSIFVLGHETNENPDWVFIDHLFYFLELTVTAFVYMRAVKISPATGHSEQRCV